MSDSTENTIHDGEYHGPVFMGGVLNLHNARLRTGVVALLVLATAVVVGGGAFWITALLQGPQPGPATTAAGGGGSSSPAATVPAPGPPTATPPGPGPGESHNPTPVPPGSPTPSGLPTATPGPTTQPPSPGTTRSTTAPPPPPSPVPSPTPTQVAVAEWTGGPYRITLQRGQHLDTGTPGPDHAVGDAEWSPRTTFGWTGKTDKGSEYAAIKGVWNAGAYLDPGQPPTHAACMAQPRFSVPDGVAPRGFEPGDRVCLFTQNSDALLTVLGNTAAAGVWEGGELTVEVRYGPPAD
ncbi:hypothetical protein [Kitasatospora sp. NPDC002040]|uniref:hypothetical protein n=1 Tax=Kitasatospora sp. NPDC002040 TaxID=3154661 RepID=UPI003323F109